LNIKALREQAGLTQAELAEKANVDQSAVSRWEIGDTRPRRRQLPILAQALGVSVEVLLAES
jgi:transcriptional regulator with XRE-family HTH domain